MKENEKNTPDYNLLAKYFAGVSDVSDKKQIEQWIDSAPENKKLFDSMYFLWIQSSKKQLEQQIDVDKAWAKMKIRIDDEKKIIHKNTSETNTINIFSKRTLKIVIQIAAAVIFIVAIKLIYSYYSSSQEYLSFASGKESMDIILADSSSISLNPNSELSYPEEFEDENRAVKLKGEAFFQVKPNPEKPFIIETDDGYIKVLGTSFNVEAYDTSSIVKVSVLTGRVELSGKKANSEKIILTAYETAFMDKLSGRIQKVEQVNTNNFYSHTKTLVFKRTELSMVVQTLFEVYNVVVEIKSDEIKSCKLTATFKDAQLEEILQVISGTFSITIEKEENTYILTGSGC